MKKWLLFVALLLAPALARAQGNTVTLAGSGAPSGSCAFIMLYINNATGDMYNCWLGTWQLVSTGGGGGVSGSGTADTLTKWTAAAIIGDSQITDDGATITLPGTVNLSGLTASRCLELDASKNITVAAAACGTGSSGANTALSNLASVSINTALLFQTGVDVGSTTKPARDFYMVGAGTFGTNYFKFTGTPTAARTMTIPDASGTLALGSGTPNSIPLWSGANSLSNSALTQDGLGVYVNTINSTDTVFGMTDPTGTDTFSFSAITGGGLLLSESASGVPASAAVSFKGGTSGLVTLTTAAAAGTWTFTLPTDDGTANQFLQTNGSGVTTWATPAGSGDITAVGSCTSGDCFTAGTPSTDLTFSNDTSGTMTLETEQGAALGSGTATIPAVGGVIQTDQNTPAFPSTSGDTQILTYNDASPPGTLDVATVPRALSFTIQNSSGLGTSDVTYIASIPFPCTISAYNLAIDTGTITVKFWKVATGTAIPTSGDSINTSGVAISSGTRIHSTTLSDFTTTTVAADDVMAMAVTAVSGATIVNGVLQCDQTVF